MKHTSFNHKYSPCDIVKALKFQSKRIRLLLIPFSIFISCITLIACYDIIGSSQQHNRDNAVATYALHETNSYVIDITPVPQEITIHREHVITEPVEAAKKIPIAKQAKRKTIYDYYTHEEVEMLERLVESEATAGNIQDKMNVASVVFNRIESKKFPNTIEEIIFQESDGVYQFSVILDKRYYKVSVTDETREAVKKAFEEGDTTDGAIYFCKFKDVKNEKTKGWFKKLHYIMTDDLGHSYFKDK